MMSSSNNDYNDGNNNGVYPLSLYLPSLSGHQDIIRNPYNQQLTASMGQMVSAVPESLVDYMGFNANNTVNQQGLELPAQGSREIKKTAKKDRHTKIHTAQGLRDRRVRLSIGVARQFFDLQDMLGFDKASKTLDWLLNKSRKAIKEVVQGKKLDNGNEDSRDNGGDVEEEVEEEDGDKSFVYGSSLESTGKKVVCEVMRADKRKKKELSNISSKGSSANARGKAKERTREMPYDHPETNSDITYSETMEPFNRSIVFGEGEYMTHFFSKGTIEEFHNQDSNLTKMKINMPTNMDQSYNHHTGAFMLMDQGSSSNYNIIDLPRLDYNYEQNPFVDQTFCAITDTKFPGGFP